MIIHEIEVEAKVVAVTGRANAGHVIEVDPTVMTTEVTIVSVPMVGTEAVVGALSETTNVTIPVIANACMVKTVYVASHPWVVHSMMLRKVWPRSEPIVIMTSTLEC